MEISARHGLNAARAACIALAVSKGANARRLGRLAFVALWLYPTLRRNCTWHGEVIRRLGTPARRVWITIDDGPGPRCMPAFLELLAARGARASFFVVGRRIRPLRELCRRAVEAGHSLENHSWSHNAAFWWAAPPWTISREMAACSREILTQTGHRPRWFRSPVGMNNPWVHPAAARAGLRVAGWSAAGGDACPDAPSRICERVTRGLQPGAIVVLHEGRGARHRAKALELILDRLAAEGYSTWVPDREGGL